MAGKLLTQILGEIRGGVFVNAASAELSELVERIQESGKKGSISITLEIAPHGKNNREMHVTPKLTVKKPAAPDTTEAGIFYAVRGDLVRDDPEQRRLPGMEGKPELAKGDTPVADVAGPRAFA